MKEQSYYERRVLPVLDALAGVGVEVTNLRGERVIDLHNYRVDTSDADVVLPILRAALDEERFEGVAGDIAHAMAVPALADQVLPDLVARMRGRLEGYHFAPGYDGPGDPNESMRYALGSAVSLLASPKTAETMLDVVRDSTLGKAREPVVTELKRTRHPDVSAVLMDLLHDPTVASVAIAALRSVRAREALPAIRALHDSPDPEVRRQVRATLRAWKSA